MMARQYNDEAGDWHGLDSSTQAPRYSAISELLQKYGADKRVLDVGCGEAILRSYLPRNAVYTGIEPSATAVRGGLQRDAAINIAHTRAECFDSLGEYFHSIVFNEMLYYTKDPIGLLEKFASMLHQDGVILCSIYQKPGSASLKQKMWHWIDSRRPMSNVHCAQMVRAFMASEGWAILEERAVTIPGSSSQWDIWLALPRPSVLDNP